MFESYIAAAFRNLLRNRIHSFVVIACLAVGFATAIWVTLYIHDERSYERFVPNRDQIYRLYSTHKFPSDPAPQEGKGVLPGVAQWLPLEFPAVESASRLLPEKLGVRRADREWEDVVSWADPAFFQIFNVTALAGDLQSALSKPDSIVLTRQAALRYFGRENVVGESLQLARKQLVTVAAVIEDLPSATHLKLSIVGAVTNPIANLQSADVPTYVRLRSGSKVPTSEMMDGAVHRRESLEVSVGGVEGFRAHIDYHIHMLPIVDVHLHRASGTGIFDPEPDQSTLLGLGIIGALILLMTCLNFINLMTSRAARRAVEVGIRKAVGATRGDLVVQFLGESMVYAILALILAVAIVEIILPFANAFLDRTIVFPYLSTPWLGAGMLVAAILTAICAGMYPAFVLASFRPITVLKARTVTSGGSILIRQSLVIVQFAVLVGLVLAALIIYRQTFFAMNEGLRLNTDQVVLLRTTCGVALKREIQALRGVVSVACSSGAPLELTAPSGGALQPGGEGVRFQLAMTDFGFFELFGLRPVAGRLFNRKYATDSVEPAEVTSAEASKGDKSEDDVRGEGPLTNSEDSTAPSSLSTTGQNPSTDSTPRGSTVVINEELRRQLKIPSAGAAIGRTLNQVRPLPAGDPAGPIGIVSSEIVGVIPDFPIGSITEPIQPVCFYIDPSQHKLLMMRLRGGSIPETLSKIREVWQRAGEQKPMDLFFFEQHTQLLYREITKMGTLLGIAAGIALTVGGLGMFGLSAYTTERRTKEIGVRKAVGAASTDIVRMLIWEFSRPIIAANIIAWPFAYYFLQRWLEGFAYRIPLTPAIFMLVGGATLAIAWLTVIGHTLKVATSAPMNALRYE